MQVAIIGGGAAGFFAALAVKENHPQAAVTIFEKSAKLLAKVKVSGGGRCNVTNACASIPTLARAYPRGGKVLKKAFREFSTPDTMDWFEQRGVALMVQEDDCVFPVSQSSQTIIDCFLREAERLGIAIHTRMGVKQLVPHDDGWTLQFSKDEHPPRQFEKVIVATGGSPKRSGLEWLAELGQPIVDPVPSLFTFNMPGDPVRDLMGVVVDPVWASIAGTKLQADGPLLITHWGMSGPAILKLSAHGARLLAERGYQFEVQINWVTIKNNDTVRQDLSALAQAHPRKAVVNASPYGLPKRLWRFLVNKAGFSDTKVWGELGKSGLNKFVALLTNDTYAVSGKTTFKEEFVTCGGVALLGVDMRTLQSKHLPHLYFAGEVLDIDGITGGYNFQSAWTTAYVAGRLL